MFKNPVISSIFCKFIEFCRVKTKIYFSAITKGVIFELLPFNDRIENFELQGKDILLALERSVSGAWDYNPFKGPYVLQVSGECVILFLI